jgi:subtilisin family serine protease
LVALEDRRVPANLLIFEAVLPNPTPAPLTAADDVYIDGHLITGQNFDSSLNGTVIGDVTPDRGAGDDVNGHGTHVAGTVGSSTWGTARQDTSRGELTDSGLSASPKLFLVCATGSHIDEAVL